MSAETAGLSPARLAVLDRVIKEQYVDTGRLPGALIQLCRRGEIAHTGMSGFLNVERQVPMREDGIFRIYSMTKPIVAVALLMLMEEGRVGLDDEVATYLPALRDLRVMTGGSAGAFTTVPLKRPMKVIDLATHTSGVIGFGTTPLDDTYREMRIGAGDTDGGVTAYLAQIGSLPLGFQPGEGWSYGESIGVLGAVIEATSGMSLGTFLRTRIFEPLGMHETGFFCPPTDASRLAGHYDSHLGTSFRPSTDQRGWLAPPALENAGGGLVSTLADYMTFCRMLLGRGTLGVQLLSPKSVALLSTNFLPANRDVPQMAGNTMFDGWQFGGVGMSLCCGTTIDVARRRMPASAGDIFWGGAATSYVLVDPAEDLAMVFMSNANGAPFFFTLQRLIHTLVYAAVTTA